MAMVWSRQDHRHHELEIASGYRLGRTIFGQTLVVDPAVPFGLCAEKAIKRGAATFFVGGKVEPLMPSERESRLRCVGCDRLQFMVLGVGWHEMELGCPACGSALKLGERP